MPEGIVARVDAGGPRFQILPADDIDHSTDGIRAIKSRRGPFHNLYAPHVVEVHTAVVDVVHGLSCHSFAIDEEEHGIPSEATHVERRLLRHGQAEFQSGNLLCEHVLNVGGIGNLNVMKGNETRHHRCIFQGLGRMRCCHHHRLELYRVADG